VTKPSDARQTFALIARHYRTCHKNAISMVEELSDEQFRWRPSPGPQSVGWNLWHIARWDDYFAEVLIAGTPSLSAFGPPKQIWKAREVARGWGLESAALGLEEGGTHLTDQAAAAIALPSKKDVIEYATEAFAHLDRVLPELDDSLLEKILPSIKTESFPDDYSYGDNAQEFLIHAYEHLGTMQALKGMLGFRGSVTD
jgi:DinB family protein